MQALFRGVLAHFSHCLCSSCGVVVSYLNSSCGAPDMFPHLPPALASWGETEDSPSLDPPLKFEVLSTIEINADGESITVQKGDMVSNTFNVMYGWMCVCGSVWEC